MPGLVNEKTLELNITHEGLANVDIGVIGFTQQQESRIGADVFYPCARPFIIQFKAAKEGIDNSSATFYVNNNKRMNQHRALDAIATRALKRAMRLYGSRRGTRWLWTGLRRRLNNDNDTKVDR